MSPLFLVLFALSPVPTEVPLPPVLPAVAVPAPAFLGDAHLYMRTADGHVVFRLGGKARAAWDLPHTDGLALQRDGNNVVAILAQRDGPPLRATGDRALSPVEGLGPGPVAVGGPWVIGSCESGWCAVGPNGTVELGWNQKTHRNPAVRDSATLAVVVQHGLRLVAYGVPDPPPPEPGCAYGAPVWSGDTLIFVERCTEHSVRRLSLTEGVWTDQGTWCPGVELDETRPAIAGVWTAALGEGRVWAGTGKATPTSTPMPAGSVLHSTGTTFLIGHANAWADWDPRVPETPSVSTDPPHTHATFHPITGLTVAAVHPNTLTVSWVEDGIPPRLVTRLALRPGPATSTPLPSSTSRSGARYDLSAATPRRARVEDGALVLHRGPPRPLDGWPTEPDWTAVGAIRTGAAAAACSGDRCDVWWAPRRSRTVIHLPPLRCVSDEAPLLAAGMVGGRACMACARHAWDAGTETALSTIDVACSPP